MSRPELIAAFSLNRCLRASAQMDMQKMTNLNGLYIAEMPAEDFLAAIHPYLTACTWADGLDEATYRNVALFMQSRVKRLVDVEQWEYFFTDIPAYDEKLCAKQFKDPAVCQALRQLPEQLAALPAFTATTIENAIHASTETAGLTQGKLNQPIRAAVTGSAIGAGIYETLELIGRDRTIRRLQYAQRFLPTA